jgi:hypothetical protein
LFKTKADKINFVVQLALLIAVGVLCVHTHIQIRAIEMRLDGIERRLDQLEKNRIEIERQVEEIRRWQQRHDSKYSSLV